MLHQAIEAAGQHRLDRYVVGRLATVTPHHGVTAGRQVQQQRNGNSPKPARSALAAPSSDPQAPTTLDDQTVSKATQRATSLIAGWSSI